MQTENIRNLLNYINNHCKLNQSKTMKTLKDRYYNYVLREKSKGEFKQEEIIAFLILQDFTDRRGLRQEWEQIDDDIQNEIIRTWVEIIKNNL
jgi:hypothetical protein